MAKTCSTFVPEQGSSGRPHTTRPVVYSTQGIISSGHYLTSMAGMRMLLNGGNAFDAVVAAGFAAAVVEPIASYSLAAEGVFMLYHKSSGDVLSLSGQGTAPRRATIDFYKSQGFTSIPTGPGSQAHLSFTVPGIVDAYIALLERYGTKTLGETMAPAVRYAERGIPHWEYMVDALDSDATRRQFDLYPPGGMGVFYEGGSLPRPGTPLVQAGLANTLKRLASAENSASGDRLKGLRAARDSFYRGEIGQSIVNCSASVGGILGLDDLADYHATFEEPSETSFHGYRICGQTSWSQAPALLQALNILERFDLASMGHNTPIYIHNVVESLKLAMADREAYYGDPDFVSVPLDGLVSKEYAVERASLVDVDCASPELPTPGDPWKYSAAEGARVLATPRSPGSGCDDGVTQGTTHISVIDQDGNIVAATPSGGAFSKSVFFPELGCALSTRIEMFNFEDGHANALEPRKRPRTTLVNYMVLEDGVPTMAVGCPGGDHQVQANLQLLLNTLVFKMNPQEAIEAPRFATDSVMNSFYPHSYYPGQLSMEDGFPDQTIDALNSLGHKVVRAAVCGMGATVSRRDLGTGVLSTGADPRRACYALGC